MDTGATLHMTHCEIVLAETCLRDGRTTAARDHVDAARAYRARLDEDYLAAEIDRLDGLLRYHERAAFETVEECLSRSLHTARRQGARLFELRTATTFAPLLAERNQRRRAAELLGPVVGAFTEGFDTADLREAKAVLDELG
jgi:predicted ATPase